MEEIIRQLIKRVEKLEETVFSKKETSREREITKNPGQGLDFKALNVRAFMKRHAINLSGPKKFVLLVAYLAQGDIAKEIKNEEIKKTWQKMSGKNFLGAYNDFYPNSAKTNANGWVNSSRHGYYNLTSEWFNIFN